MRGMQVPPSVKVDSDFQSSQASRPLFQLPSSWSGGSCAGRRRYSCWGTEQLHCSCLRIGRHAAEVLFIGNTLSGYLGTVLLAGTQTKIAGGYAATRIVLSRNLLARLPGGERTGSKDQRKNRQKGGNYFHGDSPICSDIQE